MNTENQVSENNPSPNSETNKKTASANADIAPASAPAPQFPPSHAHWEITCKQEKNWWDKIKPLAETIALIALIVYTCYTIKMYSANKEAAEAARDAANVARQTLWATEGANITTKKPTFDVVSHRALLPFGNDGHTASGPATITAHEATFSADPQTGASKAIIEAHWETGPVDSIPTTEPNNSGEIAIPAVTLDGLMKGTQIVTIAGEIDYDIGIPNAPTRAWVFCYSTHFNWNTKKSETDACMPSRTIPMLKVIEHYPNNGTHY